MIAVVRVNGPGGVEGDAPPNFRAIRPSIVSTFRPCSLGQMAPAACHACGKSGCKLLRCGRCRVVWFCNRESARSPPQGRATRVPTAAPPTDHMHLRRSMPRWRRPCRTPPSRVQPRRAWTQHRWRPLRAPATHAARATASCCAAVGAGACGSATASARSPPQGRATRAPTAAPPTDHLRPRRPMPRWRRACRTPPGRAPPRQAWTQHRWRPLRSRVTPTARARASSCSAPGAGTHGSATASARSSLDRNSATGAQTAAPPQEFSRVQLPLLLRLRLT